MTGKGLTSLWAYISFNAGDSQVSSYTPFNFSFTVPLIKEIFYKMFSIYWIKLIIYHWELQPGLVWFLLFKLKYIEVTELSYILFMYNFSSAEKKGKKFCLIWSNRDRKTQLARTRIKLLNQRDKNIEI